MGVVPVGPGNRSPELPPSPCAVGASCRPSAPRSDGEKGPLRNEAPFVLSEASGREPVSVSFSLETVVTVAPWGSPCLGQ